MSITNFDVIGARTSGSFPGTLTRPDLPHEVTSGEPLSSSTIYFGNPIVRDSSSGEFRSFGASDTVAYGFAVKAFPTTQAVWPPQGFSFPEQAPTDRTLSILRQGYIATLVLGATAPVQGGVVYVQITADTGIPVGSVTASADSGKAIAIPGAQWAVSGVDANGFAEIRFNATV